MLLKNFSSLLALGSLAFNVQAGLIPQFLDGVGVSAVEARTAPHLERRVSQPNLDLAKRAPPPLLSDEENSILRLLSVQIRDRLSTKDLVFFVGNSGSYLLYPFDQTSFNVHSLPASKTKIYGTNQQEGKGKASNKGLDRYYGKVLLQRLDAAEFNRIVIVDHSGTGKSVDGFRVAFEDIIGRAKDMKKLKKDDAKRILNTPWYFINVVDWRRRPSSKNPTVKPKSDIIKKVSIITLETDDDVINAILADENKHPRVACEYWPSRWESSVRDCWAEDGTLGIAEAQKRAIIAWNEANGGLIDRNNPERESKPDDIKKNKDKLLGTYTSRGYKYEVREYKNGKKYLVRYKPH